MIGFESLKLQLINNFQNQKLHHGILIHGKKGSGKSSFAKEFCYEVLKSKENFIANVLVLEKKGEKKSIGIDEIRDCSQFLNQTSAISDYKFLIIDSACELTKQASNALLKILEEPKNNNFLILIAHSLSKVIPTLRSRCSIIRAPELNQNQFEQILSQKKLSFSNDEIKFLSEICDNSPAIAIQRGQEIIRLYQLFLRSILNKEISDEFFKKISEKNFDFFIFELILFNFLSRFLKTKSPIDLNFFFEEAQAFNFLAQKFSTEQVLFLVQDFIDITNKVLPLYLDKKISITNIFNRICY